jgi:hypothetical protein
MELKKKLPEVVAADAEDCRPQDRAGRVGNKKISPRHPVHAGKEGSEDAQEGDEPPQEDDFSPMLLKKVLANFDACVRETHVAPVAQQDGIGVSVPDPVAGVVSPMIEPNAAAAITNQMFSVESLAA